MEFKYKVDTEVKYKHIRITSKVLEYMHLVQLLSMNTLQHRFTNIFICCVFTRLFVICQFSHKNFKMLTAVFDLYWKCVQLAVHLHTEKGHSLRRNVKVCLLNE